MALAKTFLAGAIAIIFTVFIAFGLHVIYEPPEYTYTENDCNQKYNCEKTTQDSLDQYNYNYSDTEYQNCYSKTMKDPSYKMCLDSRDKCVEESEKQNPEYIHARNSFFIIISIAIGSIILGILLTKLESIGPGLMGGGVLLVLWSLIYTWKYWFTLNKYIKLVALGIVLVILIYLGYKKIENKETPKKFKNKRK